METTLTKHLYRLDEVCAALSYCCTRKRVQEALFWCLELVESGYGSYAISSMFETWIWLYGIGCLKWFESAWNISKNDNIYEEDILLLCYNLASLDANKRDMSLLSLLVLDVQNRGKIPDRLTAKGGEHDSKIESMDDKEIAFMFFDKAIQQGKARLAWWIYISYINDSSDRPNPVSYFNSEIREQIHAICVKNIDKKYNTELHFDTILYALQKYDNILGYENEQWNVVIDAFQIMCASLGSNAHMWRNMLRDSFAELKLNISPGLCDEIDSWKKCSGRRMRRVYEIPKESLYGKTKRGEMSYDKNTLCDIYNIEHTLSWALRSENDYDEYSDYDYWTGIFKEYIHKGAIEMRDGIYKWIDDDALEEFYSRNFPDDIPDEWSLNDQKKSHGDGKLSKNETITFIRMYRNWLYPDTPSRLVWDMNFQVRDCLDKLSKNMECKSGFANIVSYYMQNNNSINSNNSNNGNNIINPILNIRTDLQPISKKIVFTTE